MPSPEKPRSLERGVVTDAQAVALAQVDAGQEITGSMFVALAQVDAGQEITGSMFVDLSRSRLVYRTRAGDAALTTIGRRSLERHIRERGQR